MIPLLPKLYSLSILYMLPSYTEHLPHERLRAYVANYWKFSIPKELGGTFYHVIPPDGCVSLVFSFNEQLGFRLVELSGAGFMLSEVEIPANTTFIGVRIRPGAYAALFDIPLSRVLKEQFVDVSHLPTLQVFLDALTASFEEYTSLDVLLLPFVSSKAPVSAHVNAFVERIVAQKGQVVLKALYEELPVSARQFQRIFKKRIGVTPKEFAQLYRMRQAFIGFCDLEQNLTHTAYEAGFFDQSHLVKASLRLAQQTPKKLQAVYRAIQVGELTW